MIRGPNAYDLPVPMPGEEDDLGIPIDDLGSVLPSRMPAAPPPPEVLAMAKAAPSNELADAQRESNLLNFLSQQGRGFDEAGRIIAGVPGRMEIDPAAADRPVVQYQQRAADAKAKAADALALRMKDKNSPESAAARAQVKAVLGDTISPEALGEVTAANAQEVMKVAIERGGLQARKDATAAQIAATKEEHDANRQFQERMVGGQQAFAANQQARAQAFQEGLTQGQNQFHADEAAKNRAAELERAQLAKEKPPQTVPATEAAAIGNTKAALKALDELGAHFDALSAAGWTGKAKAKFGEVFGVETDPAKYEAILKAVTQAVGTILEHGKLAAGDELKYKAMLPAAGDPPGIKQAKIDAVKKLLADTSAASVEALGAAGYNTKGLSGMAQPSGGAQAPAQDGKVLVQVRGKTIRIPRANLEKAKARYPDLTVME